jgi:hypothetical protein
VRIEFTTSQSLLMCIPVIVGASEVRQGDKGWQRKLAHGAEAYVHLFQACQPLQESFELLPGTPLADSLCSLRQTLIWLLHEFISSALVNRYITIRVQLHCTIPTPTGRQDSAHSRRDMFKTAGDRQRESQLTVHTG